jgi:hypothetical protein
MSNRIIHQIGFFLAVTETNYNLPPASLMPRSLREDLMDIAAGYSYGLRSLAQQNALAAEAMETEVAARVQWMGHAMYNQQQL